MADPIRAFPKRLREAREAAGMSTEELARRRTRVPAATTKVA